jgi:hypothetical protein
MDIQILPSIHRMTINKDCYMFQLLVKFIAYQVKLCYEYYVMVKCYHIQIAASVSDWRALSRP